ncbi:MAG: hypothetical protein RMK89_01560 [Armatimonadota bacterium]|nr:hypothetical protein [Armatimonadota bacterium]MDW8142126.1 hypothetical protein [Armatimonadota bacterium]
MADLCRSKRLSEQTRYAYLISCRLHLLPKRVFFLPNKFGVHSLRQRPLAKTGGLTG